MCARDDNFISVVNMKRKAPYAAPDRYYEFFTKRQRGYGMPVFIGRAHQRGHGVGNVLGGLVRRVVGFLGGRGLDFLKQNRGAAVSNLIKTGANIVKDVSSGKKVKDSLKTRLPEGIKQTARELQFQLGDKQPSEQQQQQPRKHRPVRPKKRKGPKIRHRKDIFS